MTRKSMVSTLRRTYVVLALVLIGALAAKLANLVPGLRGTLAAEILASVYDYLKDMTLVIITVIAAYLANVFQKRSIFINALEREWRRIVNTKSALYAYTQLEQPSARDYVETFCRISESIDNMRTVYRNVGETNGLIGIYPYAPLHDMRRALQTLDPRKEAVDAEKRKVARDAILQSFYALRESFLEELDLEQPSQPLLISGAKRLKVSGAERWARRAQARQFKHQSKATNGEATEADALLKALYDREMASPKSWRSIEGERDTKATDTGTKPPPSETA